MQPISLFNFASHLIQRVLHVEETAKKQQKVAAEPPRAKDRFEAQARPRVDPGAEAHAIGQTLIVGQYQALLGRAPTADELQAAMVTFDARIQGGQNVAQAAAEIVAGLRETPEAKLKAGVDGFTQALYQGNLNRPPTADELKGCEDLVKKLLADGKNIFEAGAVLDYLMKIGDEYKAVHPLAPWIRDTFQELLGRQPSAEDFKGTEGVINSAVASGKNIFEAGALVHWLIKTGPEYQASHPDVRGKILDVAQGEVGTLEATNNNDGDVAKYPGYFGRGPESYCANFVSYVLSNAGIPTDFFNTETMKNAFVEQGKWKGTDNPQPGDVVWFDWDRDGVTDHVGLVKSVNPDGSIHTIEGNTGNSAGQEGVWECDRPMDLITGFANPA